MRDIITGANNNRIETLRHRSDFLRLRSGKRVSTQLFTLQMRHSSEDANPAVMRVGYTVTSKTGNAVERNRIKRRLRKAVVQVFPHHARAGFDYVLIARRPCLDCRFQKLVTDIGQALDRIHANRAKGSEKPLKN